MERPFNENKILQIAKSKGYFTVTWRYRDDWIRDICKRLVKQGKMYLYYSGKGVDSFKLINK